MKRLLWCSLLLLPASLAAQPDSITTAADSSKNTFLDPTGTYGMGPGQQEEEPYERNGEIRVKYLGNKRIAVCMVVCSAPPANNLGAMWDTLYYDKGWAEWRTSYDATCVIRFAFSAKGVNLRQTSQEPDFPCDFGHNVHADGFYRKESSKVPVIRDISSGED